MKITNHDLHIMLTRIEERQKTNTSKIDTILDWQVSHEEKDEQRFGSLNKYAASVAIVAASIGAFGSFLWDKLTGKI